MKLDDIVDTQPKTRKMRNAIKHKKLASAIDALSKDKQNSDKHRANNTQIGTGVGDYNDEGEFDSGDTNMGEL
jgi:hypothetical protein